jgi:NAD(P)-dependent dehydrogenase (short-subunit alcohol dehydrogenase family)
MNVMDHVYLGAAMTTVLITGVTSGIGRVMATRLAADGATVIAVARNAERGEPVAADIARRHPGARVDLLTADLSDLAQVRALAGQVRERHDRLDVLVHNAAVAKFRRETTRDGLEATFATNHLAPYLLTRLLAGRLGFDRPARVVTVSSEVHRQVRRIPWDDLQGAGRYRPTGAYNLSKLANILFTTELARRLDGTRVTANAVSPGFVRTGLTREATGAFRVLLTLARPWQSTPEQGARTPLHVATAPEVAGVTGRYFHDGRPAEPSALARDRQAAGRLWQLSADLCGLPPDGRA